MFQFLHTIQLYHVDAAGLIFYGNIHHLIHDAFAAFLKKNNVSIQDRLNKKDFFFPVCHTQVNFNLPLRLEDLVLIKLWISRLSKHSFEVCYEIIKEKKIAADAKIIHVCVHGSKMEKIPIPKKFQAILKKYTLKESSLNLGE